MQKLTKLLLEYRTIKVTIVIFLCNLFYILIGQENATSAMMVAGITAIIGIHPDTSDAWIFAKYRLIGTGIGCLAGIIYFLISFWINNLTISYLVILPIIIFITVVICGGFKRTITVLGAVIAIVVMTLISNDANDWSYVWERMLATAVGVGAAILVNWIIHPGKVNLLKELIKAIKKEKDKTEKLK